MTNNNLNEQKRFKTALNAHKQAMKHRERVKFFEDTLESKADKMFEELNAEKRVHDSEIYYRTNQWYIRFDLIEKGIRTHGWISVKAHLAACEKIKEFGWI